MLRNAIKTPVLQALQPLSPTSLSVASPLSHNLKFHELHSPPSMSHESPLFADVFVSNISIIVFPVLTSTNPGLITLHLNPGHTPTWSPSF